MSPPGVRPILERLAFVIYLALFVGSCGLTGLGLIFAVMLGNPQPLILGCGGTVLTALIRDVGYRQWHFGKWEASLDAVNQQLTAGTASGGSDNAAKLDRVLNELRELDTAPASEGRDVWRVQRLRHQAKALLEREPALRHEFSRELARHPEIG